MEKQNNTKKLIQKIFWDIVIVVFLVISLVLSYIVYTHYAELNKEQDEFEEIAETVKNYKSYAKLKQKNEDMVGWLKMKGTKINYPVMIAPEEDPNLYEHHDFKRNYSFPGSLFMDYDTDLIDSQNFIIYGHHMFNGTMFGGLQKDIEKGKRKFVFDKLLNDEGTSYERGTYKVVCAFKTSTNTSQPFYNFTNIFDLDTYDQYIKMLKENNEIEGDVDISYRDDIITLITCSYHLFNSNGIDHSGRYLVVGQKIKSQIIYDE